MYLLRRTAARALSTTPSQSLFVKPRSITTIAPAAFRPRQQPWATSMFQRRFASDEATKSDVEVAAAEAESFAQTTPEAPVEENLTPAQADAQAPPSDASATAGPDALEAASHAPLQTRDRNRYASAPAAPNQILYVGNLYYEVTQEQLDRVFSRFGTVEEINIVRDNRGLSRGFAYVKYKEISDAQTAIQSLDMQVFEGRNLVVQFHKAKPNRLSQNGTSNNPPSKVLFIGNMSFEMTDKDLNDLFREIQNVTDVRVAIDRRTGQPRGFAHADFIDVQSAQKAREILKDKVVHGRQLRIDFGRPGGWYIFERWMAAREAEQKHGQDALEPPSSDDDAKQ